MKEPQISRRTFMKGAAVGIASIGAAGAIGALSGCESDAQGSKDTDSGDARFAIAAGADATGTFQLDKTYPVKPDDKNVDEHIRKLLVTAQMDTFFGYEGQGTLLFNSDSPASFALYVNGQPVGLSSATASDWNSVDISEATVTGDNRLQVSMLEDGEATFEVRVPYPTLIDALDEGAGNANFDLIDQIIEAEIANGYTSAEVIVVSSGKVLKQSAFGVVDSYTKDGTRITDGVPVTNDTLYDLASITKMFATNYAVQKLVSDGTLDVSNKVNYYLPGFVDGADDAIKGKDDLTLREVLEHQAGFPADPQYPDDEYNPADPNTRLPNTNPLYTQNRDEVLQKIIETPLQYAPGTKTRYSDVDYMLLGFIVEAVTGQRLDAYVKENIYAPLGLTHVTFNPLQNGFTKDDCAAEELNGNTRDGTVNFNNIRTETIQGEVHDEKAFYCMDGVSGHAGLFSNAHDLATLAQVMLNRGGYGTVKLFDEATVDQFIKPKDTDASYGLGWRRKDVSTYAWVFSPLSDTSTIGHTGWVGCAIAIDPVHNTIVATLSNKKNTLVLDPVGAPDDFIGDHYLTANYGMVSTLAMDALSNSGVEACDSKLVDMVRAKYAYMQAADANQKAPDKAVLQALVDCVNERQDGSDVIASFMGSDLWNTIGDYLA